MSRGDQEIKVPEGDDPNPYKVEMQIINRYTQKPDWEQIGFFASAAEAIKFAQSRQDRRCRVIHKRKSIYPSD